MSDFRHDILDVRAHRPWPMPERPWVMTQTWHDLLFAHWPVDPDVLRLRVPLVFPLDTFDGRAWIGVVPFYMRNVAPRFVPTLPLVSAFAELNVRTYVTVGGKPGVFFFSLDAGSTLAVVAARASLRLPYFRASMSVRAKGADIAYESRRRSSPAALEASYRPVGVVAPPVPGTLEYFLTERYCLYAIDHFNRPYRLDIHHPPWPLQSASAELRVNTMADAAGVQLPATPPLLHFSKRQDMVAWLPERLASADPA